MKIIFFLFFLAATNCSSNAQNKNMYIWKYKHHQKDSTIVINNDSISFYLPISNDKYYYSEFDSLCKQRFINKIKKGKLHFRFEKTNYSFNHINLIKLKVGKKSYKVHEFFMINSKEEYKGEYYILLYIKEIGPVYLSHNVEHPIDLNFESNKPRFFLEKIIETNDNDFENIEIQRLASEIKKYSLFH